MRTSNKLAACLCVMSVAYPNFSYAQNASSFAMQTPSDDQSVLDTGEKVTNAIFGIIDTNKAASASIEASAVLGMVKILNLPPEDAGSYLVSRNALPSAWVSKGRIQSPWGTPLFVKHEAGVTAVVIEGVPFSGCLPAVEREDLNTTLEKRGNSSAESNELVSVNNFYPEKAACSKSNTLEFMARHPQP